MRISADLLSNLRRMVPLRALELASVLSLLHPQAFLKPISSDPRVMGVCFGKAEETDEERTNRMKRPTTSKRRYRDFDAVDARDHPLQEQLPPLNDDTTATVARWDWIRVTLSKSRNNYYCLVSTLDRQLFGGDELTLMDRWEEDIEDGLSNRTASDVGRPLVYIV